MRPTVYVTLLSVILNETLIALISPLNVDSGMCARSSFFANNNKNTTKVWFCKHVPCLMVHCMKC